MDKGTNKQILPVEAGGTVALPLAAVSSIQHLHFEAAVTGGGGLSSDTAPRVFDLQYVMWGQPSTERRRFVVLISEPDLTFGLLVNHVDTARPLTELISLPGALRAADQLFQGLMRVEDDLLVPILNTRRLSEYLLKLPEMAPNASPH